MKFTTDLSTYDGTVGCKMSPNTLLTWNAYNQGQGAYVIGNTAHFLMNGAYADSVYHEPWGNAARNSLRDAGINRANFQISKDTNFTERVKIWFDAAFLNVFNHPNYSSIDPFIKDAGYTNEGTGFGIPSLTNGGSRQIKFGLKIFF